MAEDTYFIEEERLNNLAFIESRIDSAWDIKTCNKVRAVLNYVYLDTVNNCGKVTLRRVEHYLELKEIYLANWLTNKSDNTKGKKAYGQFAILEAKRAKYACRDCGHNDVRCLEIDHIDSDRKNVADGNFKCLCGNCHNIKTRNAGLLERVNKMRDDKKTIIHSKFL